MPEKCTGVINLRYKDGSLGSASNPEMFHMQNFEQLKQLSLRRGSLFVDTTFPPDSNSLGDIQSLQRWQQQQVKWRRPAEIKEAMGFSGTVSFIVDGASRLDFGQGMIDMHAGSPSEAFKDFCGGVFMNYELRNEHDNDHDKELWGTLTRATACQAMIGCGTFSADGTMTNTVARNGLVASHAYAVTGVNEVRRLGSAVRLVRLLNPWGFEEWTGKWGDKMELEDYCHNFNYMSVCCENPNFMDGDVSCQWQCMSYNGRWIAGKEAGGNFNEPTFEQNPQFRFKVSAEAGDDEGHKNLLVSLMQKRGAHRKESTKIPIGFCVFKATARKLDSSFLRYNLPLIQSMYTYNREIMDLSKVEPGEYFVVPNTMHPNCSGEFLLTIYTKARVQDHGDQDGRGDHNETPAEEVTPKPQGIQGKIDYPAFVKLWKKCISYKELFDRCDTDHSGMLSLMETMNAAQSRAANMPEKCTGIINLRHKDGSVESVSNPEMFHRQNFEQLKQLSLRRGSLFVDTTFPPNSNSLGDIPSLQR
ncbi:hypothetical protein CRUP_037310 [Coryphaenoides rupestris]|nr:hypothetical protein CRUP_037310 [Coryphaenoides rupestris]